ncbi:histidine kinase [Alkalilimnicola ehrlichii]|uniref:histidine kinase n=1 Tax=Alkalilimnicola ehrlichii TaxID=351052 RepID=A0A3E0X3X1_9GAMM|nr:HAMP domain-containing sensor histidine kinase [Alkalilimnicola ehrlichii]RFA31353.1 histidine kinase [Alkalilimnicola ehrlichii]RFA39375.1 histidine kinase [Alkalilimnicola ehrlichii]
MARYYPKSTLRLILYGFAVVALPLLLALGLAGIYMDRLLDQSQNAVYKAVQATQDSRILTQQVITMERRGRQYLLLQDQALLDAYHSTRRELQSTVTKLHELTRDSPHRRLVDTFIAAEQQLAHQILTTDTDADSLGEEIAAGFDQLNELAQAILADSNQLIDQEVQIMQETGGEAQRLLVALAFTLIPLTLVSVGVFTTLISRPIRQVHQAIRHLGAGNFEQRIQVSGPLDLQHVGKRLDWLRQRLRDLENQKTRFLQHMSHELKTPLTAIRESVDLISDRIVGPLNDQQAEIAQILRSNARQLQGLIEDLLNFGTAQSHSPALNLDHVNLREVIEEVGQNHKPALLAKHVRLECEVGDIHVVGDREKLATVVDNLLSNAIKYSPPGGKIQLELSRRNDTVELAVTDEGPGIEGDDKERIFDAFYQGRLPPEGYVKGSGLGLSIAREYINAHDGSIRTVEHDGQGARLVVQLPSTVEQLQTT